MASTGSTSSSASTTRAACDARDELAPVIASTRSRVVIVDTGAVTMCRASRSTVTVWQMSKISWRWWEM